MMKSFPLTLLAALGLTIPALAMGAGAAERDANGDGLLTIEEVQAAYPEVTTESFTAMDTNADGALDAEEVAAAEEAGMMPTS